MLVASEIRRAGTWTPLSGADTVVLDYDGRHRRRHVMKSAAGLEFLLDLPQATVLREGDALVLSDGSVVAVKAAPERLMEIEAADTLALMRIAWHLGNRHTPTQIMRDRLRIRDDHVLASMLRHVGGAFTIIDAPFDPETGAFAHDHAESHQHHD